MSRSSNNGSLTANSLVVNGDTVLCQAPSRNDMQGSVLGHLLVLLYANDTFQAIRQGAPFLFVDDIMTVYSFVVHCSPLIMACIMEDLNSPNGR